MDVATQRKKSTMFAEMMEQPHTLRQLVQARLGHETSSTKDSLCPIRLPDGLGETLKQIDQLLLTGCGTSLHAALLTEQTLLGLANLSASTRPAHAIRGLGPAVWRAPRLLVAMSQSGQTHDTCEAAQLAALYGCPTVAVVSALDSVLYTHARWAFDTHAGAEEAVPSTKGFVGQWLMGVLFAIGAAWHRHQTLGPKAPFESLKAQQVLSCVHALPDVVATCLEALVHDSPTAAALQRLAHQVTGARQTLFLGVGLGDPLALEGALKLKEAALCVAHASSLAEFKHGPVAMVEKADHVIVILGPDVEAPERQRAEAFVRQLSRSQIPSTVLTSAAHAGEGTLDLSDSSAQLLTVPSSQEPWLWPASAACALQCLAWQAAMLKGIDADAPRRLVKSVQDHGESPLN